MVSRYHFALGDVSQMTKYALSEKETQALLRNYNEGYSLDEMVELYFVSERTIYRILARYGVPKLDGNPRKDHRQKPRIPNRKGWMNDY